MNLQPVDDPAKPCSGGNASYNDAALCVFRLSITNTTFAAVVYTSSTNQRTTSAKSFAVRRSVTHTPLANLTTVRKP